MLDEPTRQQLLALKLFAMASAWLEQQGRADVQALTFDERFAFLVDAQWLARENNSLARRLKEAQLRISNACVEDIDLVAHREIDPSQMRQLTTCRWVVEHHNVLITGATGTGKTYLACALAQQACRKGHRVLYRRATRLFEELTLAHADGTYGHLLERITRIDVLVLDDFGLVPPKDAERHDLLDVLEAREGRRSTLLTSQLPPAKWHEQLRDPTIADAILDRLVHNAHRLVLKGPSRRKEPPTTPGAQREASLRSERKETATKETAKP